MKALKIRKLTKTYGDNKVLKEIDLDIEQGDFFALLGHNGAGKTTTIGIMTDLVKKDSGSVKIFGNDIDENFSEAKKMIGVVPQEFNFNMFTKVGDIPVIQAGYYGIPKSIAKERTEKYLKALDLWEKKDQMAMALSGGMKRRLMIVRALVNEPKLLILDEPTAGVDVDLRKTMWDFIIDLNKSGTTILLTTHYLEEVEALCNKVAILNKGKIVKNTNTRELLASLDEEVFVFDTKEKLGKISSKLEKKYKANALGNKELELCVSKNNTLNEVFCDLSDEKIRVTSFRNKINRIEQLFINLTK